jgi:hypothetical protein
MLLQAPAPRLPGDKWGRGLKRTDESAREDVRFRVPSLAVGARGHKKNCGFSPCLLRQKAWCGS